jgi:hypothetical protein
MLIPESFHYQIKDVDGLLFDDVWAATFYKGLIATISHMRLFLASFFKGYDDTKEYPVMVIND